MQTDAACFPFEQYIHGNMKELNIRAEAPDYASAHALAVEAAGDGMLLAWYDDKNKVGYPTVHECTGDRPGWFAYADNHGADLAVIINGGEFIFVFATGLGNPTELNIQQN